MHKKMDLNTSLETFIFEYPESVDIFEQFGLGNFEKTDKNILKLAKENNIMLDNLKESLQKIVDETPSRSEIETIVKLINYIESKHHGFLWQKLPSSDMLIKKLTDKYGEKYEDFFLVLGGLFAELKDSLEDHLHFEEDIVFNELRSLKQSNPPFEITKFSQQTLEKLYKDHVISKIIVSKIKDFTSSFAIPEKDDADFVMLYQNLKEIIDDLQRHMNIEDKVLMPKIKKLL